MGQFVCLSLHPQHRSPCSAASLRCRATALGLHPSVCSIAYIFNLSIISSDLGLSPVEGSAGLLHREGIVHQREGTVTPAAKQSWVRVGNKRGPNHGLGHAPKVNQPVPLCLNPASGAGELDQYTKLFGASFPICEEHRGL